MTAPAPRTRWVIHLPVTAPDLTRARMYARTAARTLAALTRAADPGETTVSEEDDQGVRHRVFCDHRLPGGGRWLASVSRSTSRTDADERLPTSARLFQVGASASRGRASAEAIASSTLGPPGWQTQEATSARARPRSARKASTSRARKRSTTSGTSADNTIRKPSCEMSQPITRSERG